MHVDQMVTEWAAPLWAKLGTDGITALILLAVLYFTVKWAVKSGVKEAVREMRAKMESEK